MVSAGIIGSGAWGTTLALLLTGKGTTTTLWEHNPERAAEMQALRENTLFLPGFRFPDSLRVTPDIREAVQGKDMLVLVTPSQSMRENVRLLASYVEKEAILVSASKGIEIGTLKRMTEIIAEELPDAANRVAALSGPNISREVAEGKPTAAVVAAYEQDIAVRTQSLLSTLRFRLYTANDVVGVELGGALKNIIAIGAGINDGMGYGDSSKAAFITRGLAEISRLGIAAGAHPLTFAGLAGIGDLVATCASPLSRNHRLGQRLAAGEKLPDILASTRTVAEGVSTTRAALQLAARFDVEMPITSQLSLVLFEGLDPKKAVPELMMRDLKDELEGFFNPQRVEPS
ncbi:MAG TPA: NAD(P)H-dependent glycerol-3-phosphate dehydrogenase [Ktedonobacteraceae bacterium]|jgi:glycerol-3-phosphate dehydrogenase (NAD(P)+)|nr:NAD(P)H-dependent glycerol-3-phosphate dehydrogenase [Ktedonobacteraceae bacterium]